jgi:hypothetical protein
MNGFKHVIKSIKTRTLEIGETSDYSNSFYTVKFDIMEPSVPLVKFVKNPLYQVERYRG